MASDIGSPTELYSQLAYFRSKGDFTMVALWRCLHFALASALKIDVEDLPFNLGMYPWL
ncbi:hypothetical protein PHJA_000779100 [Phtheirospermum japonicum]|uniref:Uncharacterized protein n=1 Tax=Phtheirospermum japonicum TaxID=374723 RepID=A0A830BQE2_9LAMI|nr:hypothetical protein PHJA_000779100 [Phtheirospermum japonicum]